MDAEINSKSICEKWRKNWPQERAMLAGIILMISSGINLAWTLFSLDFKEQSWAKNATIIELMAVQVSWFVGAIVGGFNAGYFVDSLGRRSVIRIGIASQLVSSIVLIFSARSVIGLIFGRVIGGYGYGSAYLGLLIYAGEISTPSNRGKLVSLINIGLIGGIVLFAIFEPFTLYNEELQVAHVVGILSGLLTLVALPLNHFFTYESPVSLVLQDLDLDAQEFLVRLRNEKYITATIREDFHSMKEMVMRDSRIKGSIYKMPAFYFIIILKLIGLAVFNYPLNMGRMLLISESVKLPNGHNLSYLILAIIRFVFGVVAIFLIDRRGRRTVISWTMRMSCVALFICGIAIAIDVRILAIICSYLFEVVSSCGLLMTIDVLTSEAFTLRKKGIAISLVNFLENFIHIILIMLGTAIGVGYIFAMVILFCSAAFLAVCCFVEIPETKKLLSVDTAEQFEGIKFGGLIRPRQD